MPTPGTSRPSTASPRRERAATGRRLTRKSRTSASAACRRTTTPRRDAKRGKNSVFIVEADGLKFCHLGDLGHELTDEQVAAIGPVDVLMIPVGGIYTINGEAAKKVVAQLKPRLFIVPMHYGTKVNSDVLPIDEFLDGQKNVRKMEDSNVLEFPADLKADKPAVVVLGWTQLKK